MALEDFFYNRSLLLQHDFTPYTDVDFSCKDHLHLLLQGF